MPYQQEVGESNRQVIQPPRSHTISNVLSREIRLKRRPVGVPEEADFELAEVSLPEPGEGEILVRNLYMSVDPYMRGRMIDRPSYVPPFQLGEVLAGGSVGRVEQSRNDRFEVGDHVLGMNGWREYFISDGSDVQTVDPELGPVQSYLGVLGMPGLTAYVGLLDIGEIRQGETVFVSGAAGAVGSIACQIAKIKGCRVVGSAGSAAKVKWLTAEAGIDEAFDYKTVDDLARTLGEACPDGIDVYFDNVGGDHLEAALHHMSTRGRIVACGSISTYNATEPPPGPRDLFRMVTNRLTMRGFIVTDHWDRMEAFVADAAGWMRDGSLRSEETVLEGIEAAPHAFIGLFSGENLGKMLVRLGS